jgi:hypothetical protein
MKISGQLHTSQVYPWARSSWNPPNRRLGMPHSQSGCNGDEKNILPYPDTEPWLKAFFYSIPNDGKFHWLNFLINSYHNYKQFPENDENGSWSHNFLDMLSMGYKYYGTICYVGNTQY